MPVQGVLATPTDSTSSGLGVRGFLSLFTGKNKRVGKQLASQKILQLLHPHVKNWGSLLRMYGRESSKMVKQVTGPLHRPVHVGRGWSATAWQETCMVRATSPSASKAWEQRELTAPPQL